MALEMRAARLRGPRRIQVMPVTRPRPGRSQVLVRVKATGVCRSDLHYYLHGKIGNQVIRRYPQTLGHEPAGQVAAVGPGVKSVRPGDRVAIDPAIACGKCPECRQSRRNICTRMKFLGMPGQQGALAEYLVMPEANLVKVPAAVTYEEAAALEPLAIGLHAVRLLALRLGGSPARLGRKLLRRALVIGAGPIGLCTLAVLKLKAFHVTVCDYLPARLRIAKRMRADRTRHIVASRPMVFNAKRLAGRFDVVFEAGGTAEAVDLAIQAVRPGGTVALIGIPDGDTIPVNLHAARRKELVILNVRRSNGELAECVRLVAKKRVNLGPMLTHSGDLADTARLFDLVNRRSHGVVKAVITP